MTLSPAASTSASGKAGPAKPADVLALGAWGADSSTLAVATVGGGIYLVSRRWGFRLPPWPPASPQVLQPSWTTSRWLCR